MAEPAVTRVSASIGENYFYPLRLQPDYKNQLFPPFQAFSASFIYARREKSCPGRAAGRATQAGCIYHVR